MGLWVQHLLHSKLISVILKSSYMLQIWWGLNFAVELRGMCLRRGILNPSMSMLVEVVAYLLPTSQPTIFPPSFNPNYLPLDQGFSPLYSSLTAFIASSVPAALLCSSSFVRFGIIRHLWDLTFVLLLSMTFLDCLVTTSSWSGP